MSYQPREDSYLLEEQVIKFSKGKKVLDVGSGSGIQAEAALLSGAESVLAVDIDDKSVKNLKKKGIKAVKSNLFSNVKGKFDLIIFNPPYLPYEKKEDLESSRQTVGGKRGDEIIVRFLKEAGRRLNEKGIILIVLSSLTPKDKILGILKEKGFVNEILGEKRFFMEKLEVWKIRKKRKGLKPCFIE